MLDGLIVVRLDIMEQYGDDKTKTLSTIHWQNSETDQYQYEGDETPISNVGSDFHVYRVEWSESKIEFYLDGVKFYEKANTSSDPFNNEHYLLLNLAIGGNMGGTVPENFTDQTLEIDYVRVYSE